MRRKVKSKKFNGKLYWRDEWLRGGTKSKSEAERTSRAYRQIGHNARVVQEMTIKGKRYFVYYRARDRK